MRAIKPDFGVVLVDEEARRYLEGRKWKAEPATWKRYPWVVGKITTTDDIARFLIRSVRDFRPAIVAP